MQKGFRFNFNFTITNVFIVLSFIGFVIYFLKALPYTFFYFRDDILLNFFKFFFFTFVHGSILHFLSNAMFLYYFGNILELLLGKTKYIIFFIFCVIFSGVCILAVSETYNVIGISGFCMAILAYFTLDMKYKNNPQYKSGIVFIGLNIAIGFMPGISLYGHLFGAISGIIFYYLDREILRKKMVGVAE
ncbi:rhomboid family intramembrane serine protease [Candidatus Gracilibacteria bacterium]|nr:rhomboid family intramembrane serine protease [Candidatus Gracilibacteria bacterium]RKW23671.1 MAG: rhomboid family intramembrane serine protease [Candidatus Gracilibacteria bacterium]